MQITYKNFIIEEDKYGYVLSEIGIKEKGDNIGEEYIKEQIYPSTFERAIEGMIKRLRISQNEKTTLREYINDFNTFNEKTLNEIKLLINNK